MRIWASLLMIFIIAGCASKDKVPSGVIPSDKMEKILWDMIQADQYAALYLAKDSARINVKTETLKLYQQVFQLHAVSRDEFRESYQFYLGRPDLTRIIFDSLLAQGNRLRADSYKNLAPVSSPPSVIPQSPTVGPMTRPVLNFKGAGQMGRPKMGPPNRPASGLPAKVPGPSHHPPAVPSPGVAVPAPNRHPASGAHAG